MNPSHPQPARWKSRRWVLACALVFAGQAGLIFLLGEHSPIPAHTRGPAPAFRLSSPAAAELLTLNDPTLFALPHAHGFSGKAWLQGFSQRLPSFDWSDSPRWLPLPVSRLGQTFTEFMQTNQTGSGQPFALAEAELMVPEISSEPVLRQQSAMQVSGALARRHLITPIQLKAWPHEDALTNTVVHLVVDPHGQVFSAALLLPGSGSREADRFALEQARAARFESIVPTGPQSSQNPISQMTSGEMIFRWQTSPMPSTNAPLPILQP